MKHAAAALWAFLAFPLMAAELVAPPAIPPTTRPANQPATLPAGAANAGIHLGPAKVLLLPFAPVDGSDQKDWLGRGVQQTILTDLSRVPGLQPITVDTNKPENAPPVGGYDSDGALKIAKAQGVDFVVYGTYQIVDPELRIVGVIIDVATGQPAGGLKATGTIRDVFGMEDSLSNQARRILPQPVLASQPLNPPAIAQPGAGADPRNALAGADPGNGPLRLPQGGRHDARFDDDPADQSRDLLRYSNDYPICPGYFGSYGFVGYGFGWNCGPIWRGGYWRGGFVSPPIVIDPDPIVIPVHTRSAETAYIHPIPSTGNYAHPIPQTGNYAHPIPQTGNYAHPIPQTGNVIKPVDNGNGNAGPAKK